MIPYVTIAGVPVTLYSGTVQQSYKQETGWTDTRLSDGKLIRMAHWNREAITLSGTGWIGHGFDAVDFSQPVILQCTQSKSITGKSAGERVFTIPGKFRADFKPEGFAYVAGEWSDTPVSVYGQVVTVEQVIAAQLYRVIWMPEFTVLMQPPEEAMDPSNATYSWQVTASEV